MRARQNHLLDTFRTETTSVSSDLIAQIHTAWRTHVRENIGKGLSEAEKPVEGEEDKAWARLTELIQDTAWKQECLRRNEKFDMYFSSAVRPSAALELNSRTDIDVPVDSNFDSDSNR